MNNFRDKSVKVRGLLKDKSWVGWTDGLSVITGTAIPHVVLNGENSFAIREKDVYVELRRAYKKYCAKNEVAIVPTPVAAAIIDKTGLVIEYTRLDYYEIFHKFGLSKTHTLQDDGDSCIRIYNPMREFVGFFGVYNHAIWFDMFGVGVHYTDIFKQMIKDVTSGI